MRAIIVAANLALAALTTPAAAHGWGGHGGGFGGFGFFPWFFVPPPIYYYPPPYYPPPPPAYYPPPYARPPVSKDEMPVTPPPGADWRYTPGNPSNLPEYVQ